jgi:SHS2 domain-containing protein
MWRVEDHTADVLLVVEAETWPGLLEEAVRAFAGFVAGGELSVEEAGALRRVRKVELEPATADEAWVQWWRALLRLWTVEGLLPVSAGVREGSTPDGTRAVVRCAPAEALAPEALTDVKAVTRHRAGVTNTNGMLRGTIMLDV